MAPGPNMCVFLLMQSPKTLSVDVGSVASHCALPAGCCWVGRWKRSATGSGVALPPPRKRRKIWTSWHRRSSKPKRGPRSRELSKRIRWPKQRTPAFRSSLNLMSLICLDNLFMAYPLVNDFIAVNECINMHPLPLNNQIIGWLLQRSRVGATKSITRSTRAYGNRWLWRMAIHQNPGCKNQRPCKDPLQNLSRNIQHDHRMSWAESFVTISILGLH